MVNSAHKYGFNRELTMCCTNLVYECQSAERRRFEKTYTRATMLDRLVRNRKFSKVVADHLWLDFDGVEDLRKHRY